MGLYIYLERSLVTLCYINNIQEKFQWSLSLSNGHHTAVRLYRIYCIEHFQHRLVVYVGQGRTSSLHIPDSYYTIYVVCSFGVLASEP